MVRCVVYVAAACSLLSLTMRCSPSLRYTSADTHERHSRQRREEPAAGENAYKGEQIPDAVMNRSDCDPELLRIVQSYIGVPYRRGGMSRSGMDCSGFVVAVYSQYADTMLARSTSKLRHVGRKTGRHNARCGDLVFFRTRHFKGINHVGIMLGEKTFVHASLSSGITCNSLDEEYYSSRFVFIKRISL